MATLTREQQEFLEQPNFAVATTLRPDGSPHNTVVWVDVEDGVPSFNTAYPRAKPRHLEQNPRVAITVLDRNDPYRWLSVDGRAELTTDGADEQIDRLARKYTGAERYGGHVEGERRVTVRIRPEHVIAYGF